MRTALDILNRFLQSDNVDIGDVDLLDLFQLIASEESDAYSVLQKTFEWRHSRGLEIGKWFLAIGLALIVAYVTLLFKADNPNPLYIHAIVITLSMLACTVGLASIYQLKNIDRRYTRLSSLIADLEEIRPFLQLLRRDGII